MINAERHDLMAEPRPKQGEDVQEGRGVRPAGARAEHRLAAREEVLVADQALREPEERRRMRAARSLREVVRVEARARGRAHRSSNVLQKITWLRPSRSALLCGAVG